MLKAFHFKKYKVLITYVVIYLFSLVMINLLFIYWCTNLAIGTACAFVYLMFWAHNLCILRVIVLNAF